MRFAVPGFTFFFTTDASCIRECIDPIIPAIPIVVLSVFQGFRFCEATDPGEVPTQKHLRRQMTP
jgi:hypothetical protein